MRLEFGSLIRKKIPHGDNYIRFKDTTAGTFGDLALVTLGNAPNARSLLTWGEGMIVKKDLSVGGFVAANQGLIALGSGVEGQFDPPGIWLIHSEKVHYMTYLYCHLCQLVV